MESSPKSPTYTNPQTFNVQYPQVSPGFQNLLNNQMSSFSLENFGSFGTPEQTSFFSPENSSPYIFNTPSSYQPNEMPHPSPLEKGPKQRSKIKWSNESTILLISAWLNTSKDAIIGNDQTSSDFWERISEYYNNNKKHGPTRSGRQCKDHWNKINQKVARFNGCYARVQEAHHSRWSDEMIMKHAHDMYKSENKNSIFQLVDCWRLLKEEPKWNAIHQAHHTKRAKVSESGQYTSSSNPDLTSDQEVREVRPISQKATKRKEKEKREMHDTYIDVNARKASALEKLVAIREKEAEDQRMTKYMDYLVMDTSHMSSQQKLDHEKLCNYIKTNVLKL